MTDTTVQIKIGEAQTLVKTVMIVLGHDEGDAKIITDHIIDCELRGLTYGGLPRVISIIERIERIGIARQPVETLHETPVSARLVGKDNIGYVVAYKATEIAIDKAVAQGLSMVGADGTWYTGMLSYFAEMAAAKGLVTMIASNATPWVAPHGAVDGRFGTNPICFGFPGIGDPVIWDIGTSSIMHAEVLLARRLGQPLPDGRAFDRDGNPTRNPAAALSGAFTPWGGHKGAGLGMVVQMLGILAGSPVTPPELADFGYLVVAMRPDLMMPEQDYREKITSYAESVRTARPIAAGGEVRMPFDRSAADRRSALARGWIEVSDPVLRRLRTVAG